MQIWKRRLSNTICILSTSHEKLYVSAPVVHRVMLGQLADDSFTVNVQLLEDDTVEEA